MKKLLTSMGILLLCTRSAFATIGCPPDGTWDELKKNMLWTLTDAGARKCYLDDSDENAYQRFHDCNQIFDVSNLNVTIELKDCWPDAVCNFVKANGAPGC